MLKNLPKNSFPQIASGPVLIDPRFGLPRYWSTVWQASQPKRTYDEESKLLGYIEDFYLFAEDLSPSVSLDEAIGSADVNALSTVLESYFMTLQNSNQVSDSLAWRWKTVFGFVDSLLEGISAVPEPAGHSKDLNVRLKRFRRLYGNLRIGKAGKARTS